MNTVLNNGENWIVEHNLSLDWMFVMFLNLKAISLILNPGETGDINKTGPVSYPLASNNWVSKMLFCPYSITQLSKLILSKIFLKIKKCNTPIKKQMNNIKIDLRNIPDFWELDNDLENGNSLYPINTIK